MKIRIITVGIMFLYRGLCLGQTADFTNDSLAFYQVITQVVDNYPSVIKAQKNIDAANANINLAKSAYYPDINISGSYTRIAPVQEFDLSALGLGLMQMNPADNYSVALNLNQLIYDFGRTSKNKNIQQSNKIISELALEQTKQQISLAAAATFYNIAFLQQAIQIKDDELATLQQHLDFVQKKLAAGTSTQYEVLSTQVRISSIENQKTDIETSLKTQISQLNSFLGRAPNATLTVKSELLLSQPLQTVENLTQTAFDNRIELKMAEEKKHAGEQKLALINAQYFPSVNLMASGGWKNGFVPDINKFTANYVIGGGLKIPIFDSGRTMFNKSAIHSEIDADEQDIELAKRDIANSVIESKSSIEAAQKKVQQSNMQLMQAEQAYKLAQTSYQAGAITNLDLLDSYTNLADSKLSLYKAEIDYTLNVLKLKIALGEKIY
ncbi:MAG: TolC family protein [Paludibacter sp.]|nr:TolC family protein [Paludibacter sp.]